MPSQLFATTAATSAAIAAAAAATGVQPQELSEIGTTDLLRSAIAAVRRMPKSQQPALTALMQLPALSQQGAATALKVNFAKLRLHYLVCHCKPVPAFTWHQPAASCRGHAQLEQFFKGPQQVRTMAASYCATFTSIPRRCCTLVRSVTGGCSGCSAPAAAALSAVIQHHCCKRWLLLVQQ
jgi:hypothetical protein